MKKEPNPDARAQRGESACDFDQRDSAPPGLFIRRRRLVPSPAWLILIVRQKMLAADISFQISPSIERLKNAVAAQRRFTVSNSGINEDGDAIGCIGLRCEEEQNMKKPALSFGVILARIDATKPATVYGTVMWSVPWMRDRQNGFTAYEARTKHVKLDGSQLPTEFLRELPHLEESFVRALRRGHPPAPMLALWKRVVAGLPMPQTIRYA